MRVLHVEDYDSEKGKDFPKVLNDMLARHGISGEHAGTLAEFLSKTPSDYDKIVLDGQFPKDETSQPDVSSFTEALNYLKENGYNLDNLIVWSDSTRVHAICYRNGLACFSKKKMKKEDYLRKGIGPEVMVEMADTSMILEKVLCT